MVLKGAMFGVVGRQLGYAYEMDRGRVDAARAYLDEALAAAHLVPTQSRAALTLLGAYVAARFDRDAPRARALLAQSEGGLLMAGHTRPLTEAAIAWAEGDCAAAAERLDAARAGLAQCASPGGAIAGADEIESLRREL